MSANTDSVPHCDLVSEELPSVATNYTQYNTIPYNTYLFSQHNMP